MKKANIFQNGFIAATFGMCAALAGCADDNHLFDVLLDDENTATEKAFRSDGSPYDGLVISKIFFAAHEKYFRDCYIRITNNSNTADELERMAPSGVPSSG